MSDLVFRTFSEPDRPRILALFEAAYGKPNDIDHWSWEYLQGPRRPIVILAESDGELAGHYAVLARRVKAGDRELDAGLVVDVMTHPSFGRRGIFSKAGMEAFKASAAAGMEVLVGFPNEAAIRGHLKVGWTELGHVRVYVRPVGSDGIISSLPPVLRSTPGVASAVSLAVKVLNKLAAGGDKTCEFEWLGPSRPAEVYALLAKLCSEASRKLTACVIRDQEWLRWRLSDPQHLTEILLARNEASKEMVGALFLKIRLKDGFKTGAILDVVVSGDDRRLTAELQREAVRRCISEGCDLVVRFGSPDLGLRGRPVGLFFVPSPRKVRFIVRSTSDRPLPESVTRLDNWHIELIDHDSF